MEIYGHSQPAPCAPSASPSLSSARQAVEKKTRPGPGEKLGPEAEPGGGGIRRAPPGASASALSALSSGPGCEWGSGAESLGFLASLLAGPAEPLLGCESRPGQ